LLGPFEPFSRLLLGLFAMNWLHNVAHIAIGEAGLASYRSHTAARSYAIGIGVLYLGALRDRLGPTACLRSFAAQCG
jgi:Domain of unknown function (DUF4383)